MKIAITSDVHLGERRFRRVENHQNLFQLINYAVWDEVLDLVRSEKVDMLLVAGDLFEDHDPEVPALFHAQLLHQLDVPVHVLGGNHDFGMLAHVQGIHCLDLLAGGNVHVHHSDFEVLDAGDVNVHFIPYHCMNAVAWNESRKAMGRRNILVAHGYLADASSDDDPYAAPRDQLAKFELSVLGHVHLPYVNGKKGRVVLTPGSTMPSPAVFGAGDPSSAAPSMWVYDTDGMNLKRIRLSRAPSVISIQSESVNEDLARVGDLDLPVPPICNISYSGGISDVDESVYKKAYANCLNLSMQTVEKREVAHNMKVTGFWEHVQSEKPEWVDCFKQILAGN